LLFSTLSFFIFSDKLLLYEVENEFVEVSNALFGEPILTNYNGAHLMPANNTTAYFVSNYKVSSYQSERIQVLANNKVVPYIPYFTVNRSNANMSNTGTFLSMDMGTVFQNKRTNRNEVSDKYSIYTPFKIGFGQAGNSNIALGKLLTDNMEPFARTDSKPFRAGQEEDPGDDPVGNPLPLGDDVLVLFVLASIYVGFKLFKNKVLPLFVWVQIRVEPI